MMLRRISNELDNRDNAERSLDLPHMRPELSSIVPCEGQEWAPDAEARSLGHAHRSLLPRRATDPLTTKHYVSLSHNGA